MSKGDMFWAGIVFVAVTTFAFFGGAAYYHESTFNAGFEQGRKAGLEERQKEIGKELEGLLVKVGSTYWSQNDQIASLEFRNIADKLRLVVRTQSGKYIAMVDDKLIVLGE